MNSIDINCDLGEGLDNDGLIMPFISSANIACGYHAGDADTVRRTIDLCLEHGVAIGLHPSFKDRGNFGRTNMVLKDDELRTLLLEQLDIFFAIANQMGVAVHHVKPHGALYNMAANNERMAITIAETIVEFDDSLILYGLSGSKLVSCAKKAGLRAAAEVFADRNYNNDGSLVSRSQPGASICDAAIATEHALLMIEERKIKTVSGSYIPIAADTVCIHGDNPQALPIAKALHNACKGRGIALSSF